MAGSTYDLTIRRGDDYTFVWKWLPGGFPTDLAAATAQMKIAWARYPATGSLQIEAGSVELDTAGGDIVIDNVAHTITVVLTDAITQAIIGTESIYQLRVDVSGVKTTIASGRLVALRNVIDG